MAGEAALCAWRARAAKGLAWLADLLYPPHCVICGALGAWLCTTCGGQVATLAPPLCSRCGVPLPREGLCSRCRGSSSPLAGLRSVSYHRPPLREAVHALKYQGLSALAQPLGQLMAEYGWQVGIPPGVLVPVPLHRARQRQRGYNQSLLLADVLGRAMGWPVVDGQLLRQRNTRSQVGLEPADRHSNVLGAFRCQGDGLRGREVILVDDVLTTGATLEACAAALSEAGAASVWAFTLTRAQGLPNTDAWVNSAGA